MKTVAIVQARMSSRRLPGKNLMPVLGRPMLVRLVERLQASERLDEVCVATSDQASDDPIAAWTAETGATAFRGSLEDVLGRVLGAAKHTGADRIVEITGDCPLVDPAMVDASILRHAKGDVDYVYCVLDRVSFPIGFDAQVYARELLEEVDGLATAEQDRADVTPYIYHHPERYRLLNLYAPPALDRPDYFLCVDEPRDLLLVRRIFAALSSEAAPFGVREIIDYLDAHPELPALNRRERHEMEYPRSGGAAAQEEMEL